MRMRFFNHNGIEIIEGIKNDYTLKKDIVIDEENVCDLISVRGANYFSLQE